MNIYGCIKEHKYLYLKAVSRLNLCLTAYKDDYTRLYVIDNHNIL